MANSATKPQPSDRVTPKRTIAKAASGKTGSINGTFNQPKSSRGIISTRLVPRIWTRDKSSRMMLLSGLCEERVELVQLLRGVAQPDGLLPSFGTHLQS